MIITERGDGDEENGTRSCGRSFIGRLYETKRTYRVAKDIGVPALRINQIVKGERGISADTALRLAKYFGTSAGVWVRMQARYELEMARNELERRIGKEVKVFRAA